MNKSFKPAATLALIAIAFAFSACKKIENTDLTKINITQPKMPALVQQFSGGKLIFAGISNDKITYSGPAGYSFNDACNHGNEAHVSYDSVITYPDRMPSCEEIRSKIEGPRLGLGSK